MPNKNYTFTYLKDAIGSVNVIAVVKFFQPPKKTRGTGYSLFASITDPSLNGAKLPCIFFADSIEYLPQVKAFGDVIIMHRLVVKEFQGTRHGYGYGTTGFAASVFDGYIDAPLHPHPSRSVCHYENEELLRVQELRNWFNSPMCPVVKEVTGDVTLVDLDPLPLPDLSSNQTKQQHPALNQSDSVIVNSLWDVKPKQFCTLVGQVVGIYRYQGTQRCLVIYLWDGDPSDSDSSPHLPTFMGPPRDHFPRLFQSAELDPRLAALTCHRLSSYAPDWTVPVFVYDEHAACPVVSNLRPADIVRMTNVHVVPCHSASRNWPGCVRLVVHGGGHEFGRGVQLLPESSSSQLYETDIVTSRLFDSLLRGLVVRSFYLTMRNEQLSTAMTILQLCNIPLILRPNDAERPDVFATSLTSDASAPIGSWTKVEVPDSPDRTTVLARVAALVTEVYPSTPDQLKDVLVLVCKQCFSANNLVSLLRSGTEPCNCHSTSTTSRVSRSSYVIYPSVFMKLEDATGGIIVHSSGAAALNLLTRKTDELKATWTTVTDELFLANTPSRETTATELLQQFLDLVYKPVDLVVEMNWLCKGDLGLPVSTNQLDLQFMLAEDTLLQWNTTS